MIYQVSVIIPSFNREQSLPRAIESVLQQTLAPFEVIVIDDGSTDGTGQIISSRYSSVKYHFQENAGVSSARNLGTKISSGNWLAFLDSDDEWLPDKLLQQVALLKANPEYNLCHTDEIWIRNGVRVNPMNKHEKGGGYIFEKCLPLCAISPSSVLIKKEYLIDKGGFDEALPACEDYDLWLRICATDPVLYVPKPLLKKYGGHVDQLSRKHWGMDRFRVQALEKLVASGSLGPKQLEEALETLVKKCRILANGASKRGRLDRERYYRQKLDRFKRQLFTEA